MSSSANLSHGQQAGDSLAEQVAEASAIESSSEGKNLDKIRDILFGAQVRDHERRFTKLEAQLLAEAVQLRNDLKQRFDQLEQHIRKEVETLTAHLTNERHTRAASVDRMTKELESLAGVLQSSTAALQDQSEQAHRNLRNDLQSEATALREDFGHKHTELSAAVETAVQRLSAQKTDRASLAALFQELSQRLSDDHSASN
ncbi:MAG: hypothetical protein OJF47_002778 [Nitrospira sp.]|jgi:uncharacterized protein YPO0396|nr:MAG: hypothetical protein OJF47_002778 [Nitrospira sp.]